MRRNKVRRVWWMLGAATTSVAIGATAFAANLASVAGRDPITQVITDTSLYSATQAPWGADGALVSRVVTETPDLCEHDVDTLVASCEITAKAGTLHLPGDQAKTFWGYAAKGGAASLPGPVIVATVGETLRITLENDLPEVGAPAAKPATSLSIAGLAAPALSGSTYTFTLDRPGTYVYEPGADVPTGNRQVSLGMGGVLVVRPHDGCASAGAGCAYGDPALASTDTFNDESLVVMNDLDPALLDLAGAPGGNPLAADVVDAAPTIHLVNGKAFPDTDVIDAVAGDRVLLRYANLSSIDRTMGVLGAQQRVIGRDAHALAHGEQRVNAFLSPGQTADVVVDLPLLAYPNQRFALVDQSRRLHLDGATGTAGALTFVNIWAGAGDLTQPTVTDITLTEADLLDVANAVVDGSTPLGFTFAVPAGTQGVQMFVDQDGTLSPADVQVDLGGTGTVHASGLAQLANGPHVIWVRATSNGTDWSPAAGAAFFLDRSGPVMHGTWLEGGVGGTVRGTATMAAGSTTLTSADLAFTAADEGTDVTVAGAGVNGDDLVTTIATVTNATTVELTAPAATAVTDAVVALAGLTVLDNAAAPAVHTTADTSLTGTFAIDQASGRSFVDAATCPAPTGGSALTPNDTDPATAGIQPPAPSQVQSFDGTFAAPVSAGRHAVSVTASDERGRAAEQCEALPFVVDRTAPTLAAGLTGEQANQVQPATTDGNVGYPGNPLWQAAVWVQMTVTDVVAGHAESSNLVRIEGFLFDSTGQVVANGGTTGAVDGTGFEFVPSDGVWDEATETGYVLVPLSTLRTLPAGTYEVRAHGLDEAGNWGALTATPGNPFPTITYAPVVPLPGIDVNGQPTQDFLAPTTMTMSLGGFASGQPLTALTASAGTIAVDPALPAASTDFTLTLTGLAKNSLPAVTLTAASDAQTTTFTLPAVSVGAPGTRSQGRIPVTFTAPAGAQVRCATSGLDTTVPTGNVWSNATSATTCRATYPIVSAPNSRYVWLEVTDPTTGIVVHVVSLTKG